MGRSKHETAEDSFGREDDAAAPEAADDRSNDVREGGDEAVLQLPSMVSTQDRISSDGELRGHEQRRIGNQIMQRLFASTPKVERIGRFSVLERIGRGGMGTVYAAYDEQLDRKVAVKVLGNSGAKETASLRLKREAQAMARLSHPNVVTVHEVGDADGEVYVAMEFIRGQTFDEWIETEPGWREVLEAFTQAGRGLAAAHEAGLVHRDLKPHNIMRTEQGLVKVLDFGLAWAQEGEVTDELLDGSISRESGPSALGTDLTRTGALLGTPAYMSPEQHRRSRTDPRSDQFSFCVTLYEALYRKRPFAGKTLSALLYDITRRGPEPPPPDSRVPAWIHRIVVRGLSHTPADRWPSMVALLAALERDPARAQRRWLTVVGLAALAGVGGFAASELRSTTAELCPTAHSEREAVWPQARRERIATAFEATGSPRAADTLERLGAQVGAQVGALGTMRAEACESHRSGRQSARLFDLRTACLDARRAGLEELLQQLEHADAPMVDNAVWAAASLPSVQACGDIEGLTSALDPPQDAEVAQQVQTQREALASAVSLALAGSYAEASARAESAREEAERIGYVPLVAEAELKLGTVLMESHRHAAAHDVLTRGVLAALRSGHDEVVVEALARRMWIVADPLRRPAEARRDDEFAGALFERTSQPASLRWLLLNNRGVVQFRSGAFSQARGTYYEALRGEAAGERPNPVQRISTRFNLALLFSDGLGQPEEAAEQLRVARLEAVELLGPDHPRVAVFSAPLAENLAAAGRTAQALEVLDAALDRQPPPDAYLAALLRLHRAGLYLLRRDYALAMEDAEAALSVAEASFADDYVGTVARWSHGVARLGLGDVEGGVVDLTRAVEQEHERSGADHEFVANARWWAGYGLHRAGRLDEAIEQLERAREIYAGLGPSALSQLGRQSSLLIEAYLERGDLDRAEALVLEAQQAQDDAGFSADSKYRMTIVQRQGDLRLARGDASGAARAYGKACKRLADLFDVDHPDLAACRLAHAQALGTGARARSLAEQARGSYRRLGPEFAEERSEAEAFLAAEGQPARGPSPP